MTTAKVIQPVEVSSQVSIGRRIWTVTAMIISVLVLLLAVASIAGTWIGHRESIEAVTELMTGIEQIASTGRERITQVDTLVADVRNVVVTIEAAADQASQDVADRGLLLNLLPEENARELEGLADRIRTNLESMLAVIEAADELRGAIGDLPFVNLPAAEDVGRVQQEVQALLAGIDQLTTDVTQFRENAAAEIAEVAETAGRIDARLDTTQQNLAALDNQLVAIQLRAIDIREQFPLWATVTAIVSTAILLWISYAMVHLTRAYWREWQAPKHAAAANVTTFSDQPLPDAAKAPPADERPEISLEEAPEGDE